MLIEKTKTTTTRYFICERGLTFNVDSRNRVKVVKSTIPQEWSWNEAKEYVEKIYHSYKNGKYL